MEKLPTAVQLGDQRVDECILCDTRVVLGAVDAWCQVTGGRASRLLRIPLSLASMEVPDDLEEEFGVAVQLGRLWRLHPRARVLVEPTGERTYRASITIPGGPVADGHSGEPVHALTRALTHLGLVSDLTEYP